MRPAGRRRRREAVCQGVASTPTTNKRPSTTLQLREGEMEGLAWEGLQGELCIYKYVCRKRNFSLSSSPPPHQLNGVTFVTMEVALPPRLPEERQYVLPVPRIPHAFISPQGTLRWGRWAWRGGAERWGSARSIGVGAFANF